MRTCRALRRVPLVCAAILSVMAVGVVSAVSSDVRLVASTVLIMGGNDDPNAQNMERQFNNHFNPLHPNYGFAGHGLTKVSWPADISSGYMASQFDGVRNIDLAIRATSADADDSGDGVVVVGYSASANVVVREMRALAAAGGPGPDKLRFIVIAGPNRPNGGLFSRFPHVQLSGDLDIDNDGPNPDTDYALTDISWEYDPVSDFPTYPMNPFSLLNAIFAFSDLHSDYFDADLANPIRNPNLTGTAPDGTRYVTIAAPRLPLLALPRVLNVPEPVLLAIEPALKVLVDLGYDRTIPVWEPTPIRLGPPPQAVLAAVPAFLKAIGTGLHNAQEALRKPADDDEPSAVSPRPDETIRGRTPLPQVRSKPRETIGTAVRHAGSAEVAESEADSPTADGDVDTSARSDDSGKSGKTERPPRKDPAARAPRMRGTDRKYPDRPRVERTRQSADAA